MGMWETGKGKVMMMWLVKVNQLNLAKEGRTGVWRIKLGLEEMEEEDEEEEVEQQEEEEEMKEEEWEEGSDESGRQPRTR